MKVDKEKYSTINRPPKKLEMPSGEVLVETAGYVPARQKIMSFIEAGRRLQGFREDQFDFPEDKIDESFIDPTRRKDFDRAQATQMQIELEEKIKRTKEEIKIKKEEAKKLAEEKRKNVENDSPDHADRNDDQESSKE